MKQGRPISTKPPKGMRTSGRGHTGRPSPNSPGASICGILAIIIFIGAAMSAGDITLAVSGFLSGLFLIAAAMHFHELRQQRVQAWETMLLLEEIARNTRKGGDVC